MAFFEQHQQRQGKATPTEWDYKAAHHLAETLQANNLLVKRPNLNKWANQFRLLRTIGDVSPARIRLALMWYRVNIRGQYTPKAYSADSFREKYQAINDAMWRGDTPPSTTITEAAKKISNKLGLYWPGKEAEHELAFIQATLDAHHDLAARLHTARNRTTGLDHRLLDHLLIQISGAEQFTECWTHRVHHIACTWPKWRGNLLRWALRLDGKMFVEQAEKWVAEYCGPARNWAKVLELIK